MKKKILKGMLLLVFLTCVACQSKLTKLVQYDVLAGRSTVSNARASIQKILDNAKLNVALFPMKKAAGHKFINREQRLMAVKIWKNFLDELLILDELGEQYEVIYKNADKVDKKEVFQLSYAAFLARYRYGIEFIDFLENYPAMHTVLNEPVPELGLQKNLYRKAKFYYLNSLRGAEFVRLNTLYKIQDFNKNLVIATGISEDSAFILRAGAGIGTKQTLKNALRIVQDAGFTLWFPLQKEVSEWMGNVKLYRTQSILINTAQIQKMQSILQPGDIILERREWFLSNIGLPGYWPHAALYIGTPDERKAYFSEGSVYKNWFGAGLELENYLARQYPEAYEKSLLTDADGHAPSVIEAISEGVSFTTLEHSLAADSVVILRPRLSLFDKAIAIKRAFHFSGRPYDFNFDFLTDAELVCTELIYKVYEPYLSYTGIKFPLRTLLGRQLMTANDIAEMFDKNYGTPRQQLDFISFYDGHEWEKQAKLSNISGFRTSWKRSKWHKWTQRRALGADP